MPFELESTHMLWEFRINIMQHNGWEYRSNEKQFTGILPPFDVNLIVIALTAWMWIISSSIHTHTHSEEKEKIVSAYLKVYVSFFFVCMYDIAYTQFQNMSKK